MFLLLCFILFIWGVAGLCSDYDHEAEVRNARRDAERRHKETINALRSKGTTRITRTLGAVSFVASIKICPITHISPPVIKEYT